nr:hypothetical protein L203_01863 [Cryptococcus depauperatus CBS 7841]
MKDTGRLDNPLLSHVYENVDHFVRRVSTMGFLGENRDKATNAPPVVHAIVSLIAQATSAINLAQMSETYMPWY